MDFSDERLQEVQFNSAFLESLVKAHRPDLIIFDPLQAFIPPDVDMSRCNAMRKCIGPLKLLLSKYECTTIIICHTNKQSNVFDRNRIADSADITDICRGLILLGNTKDKGIIYAAHEKSNYGPLQPTILFSIKDSVVKYEGQTSLKDKDYIDAGKHEKSTSPARDEAKVLIIQKLKESGKMEVKELDEYMEVLGVSKMSYRRAKEDLKNESIIKTWTEGYGSTKKWYVEPIDSA